MTTTYTYSVVSRTLKKVYVCTPQVWSYEVSFYKEGHYFQEEFKIQQVHVFLKKYV